MQKTQNLNIKSMTPLISPRELKAKLPASPASIRTVVESREVIRKILRHEDPRLLVVVGPCSIYDPKAALDYATRLLQLKKKLEDRIFIVMRTYFEKPRTTIGWKGFLNDPHLTGKGNISEGLRLGRKLLLQLTKKGMPVAVEILDPIVPQFLADLVSWASIGARTTESQTHREMASGLSMPVGYKNSTEGNLEVAINAMEAAKHTHDFLGVNQDGQISIIKTTGNNDGHVILRGARSTTNYDEVAIAEAAAQMKKAGFRPAIMVDCSHGNSKKKHQNQEAVFKSVLNLKAGGNKALVGVMLESNLHEGNQKIPSDISKLQYGVSITDECIGWETTERLLTYAHKKLA